MQTIPTEQSDWAPAFSPAQEFDAEVTHMDPEGGEKNSAAIKAQKVRAAEALARRLEAGR